MQYNKSPIKKLSWKLSAKLKMERGTIMVGNSNGKDGFKELRFEYDLEEVIKKKWEL